MDTVPFLGRMVWFQLLPFYSIPLLPGPTFCLPLCPQFIWTGFVAAFLGVKPARLLVLQAVSSTTAGGMAVRARAVRVQCGLNQTWSCGSTCIVVWVLALGTFIPGQFPYILSLYPSCLCRGWVNGGQCCSVCWYSYVGHDVRCIHISCVLSTR